MRQIEAFCGISQHEKNNYLTPTLHHFPISSEILRFLLKMWMKAEESF